MSDIVERLSVAWEKQPGAAMTKINRILVERKDAIAEITRLRQLLSEAEKRESEARAKAIEESAKVADKAIAEFLEDAKAWESEKMPAAASQAKAQAKAAEMVAERIRALQSEER
ncbi:MAG: hypothetical protein [Bacteriophage sp.]|nr:MAG: hypothetical protein [Bacteriophage sp.]